MKIREAFVREKSLRPVSLAVTGGRICRFGQGACQRVEDVHRSAGS